MKMKKTVAVFALLLVVTLTKRAEAFFPLVPLGCYVNRVPFSVSAPDGSEGFIQASQTLMTSGQSSPSSSIAAQAIYNECQGFGIGEPNTSPPLRYAILPPRANDSFDVFAKCIAVSGSDAPAVIAKHYSFKMSATSWTMSAGFTGHFIPVTHETLFHEGPSSMEDADVTVDAGPGIPGQLVPADVLPSGLAPADIAFITVHGVKGKTIHWGCSYGFTYFQPARPQVDPLTGLPVN
jgi:hypothetical protein